MENSTEQNHPWRSQLDAASKEAIRNYFDIDVDGELLSPMVDYIFKRLFTADDKRSKIALMDFLNSALGFTGETRIVDLIVINPVMTSDVKQGKKAIFDVRVNFNDGEQAIVEMQFASRDDFRKRSQFVISKAFASQSIAGQDYAALNKCYLIGIVNFGLFDDKENYIHEFRFRDASGVELTDSQTILFLEVTKIHKLLKKPVEELTDLDCWLLFFKYASNQKWRDKINEIIKEKGGISVAFGVLAEISSSVQERIQYENELLYELDINTMINNRERKWAAAQKALAATEKALAIAEDKARAIAKEKARAETDKARAETDKARAETDKARAETEKARAEETLVKQQNAVKSLLVRGILTEAQIAEVLGITEEK